MATKSGQQNIALRSWQGTSLEAQPWTFSFFQAVRLLQREGQPVGRFSLPSQESVRFHAVPSFAFPPSELGTVQSAEDGPPRLETRFFGFTGVTGILPNVYTSLAMERRRAGDSTLTEFLNLFHHRLTSLFYRAWEKHRFMIAYERGEIDSASACVRALVGLGTPHLQNRLAIEDASLYFYSGLLTQQPRNANSLEQLVSDYFDVPVEVIPFAGTWRPVGRESQTWLMDANTPSEQLGIGTILGDEVWDQQSVIRLRIGPLPLPVYRSFLPGGDAWKPVRSLVRFFCGDDLDVETQLVLRRQDAQAIELGGEPLQLGWDSWLFTKPLPEDPSDTILPLWELT